MPTESSLHISELASADVPHAWFRLEKKEKDNDFLQNI
jgi:hypothetical protein